MKKLIPWESSCFSISPEFFVVWLIYSDEELFAAKRNRLVVNRTFSGRRFAGSLPFFRVGQGGVLEKHEASAEGAGQSLNKYVKLLLFYDFSTVCFSFKGQLQRFHKLYLFDRFRHVENETLIFEN